MEFPPKLFRKNVDLTPAVPDSALPLIGPREHLPKERMCSPFLTDSKRP
jgi:hypothetical protein